MRRAGNIEKVGVLVLIITDLYASRSNNVIFFGGASFVNIKNLSTRPPSPFRAMQPASSRDQNDSKFSHEIHYGNGSKALKCRRRLVPVDQRRQQLKNKAMKRQKLR